MQTRLEDITDDLSDDLIAEQAKNKVVVIGMDAMNLILAISYFIEVLKNQRSLPEYLIVFLLTILPTVIMTAVFLKDKTAASIRYIAMISYIIFYAYVMLTTDKMIVFCYIIVLMTLLMVYGRLRLALICSASGLLINIISVTKLALTRHLSLAFITEIEVAIACIVLMSFYSIMTSRLNERINTSRIHRLDQEKKQTSEFLETALSIAGSMEHSIKVLTDETYKLDVSISDTKSSMEDLAEGAEHTAEAIMTQQEKTSEIQQDILTLEGVAGQITGQVKTSEQIVSDSKLTMEQLLEQVANSEKTSQYVAEQMQELKAHTSQMQDILTLINNVASQTGMLALNASIEAARAGEAGKGFAVVADQISSLSSQTKNATGNIHQLIEGIGQALEQTAASINSLLDSNRAQTEYVNDTAKEFSEIHIAVNQILQESDHLDKIVQTVSKANGQITESIQNVSASTEQITAKAAETLEGANADKDSVEKTLSIVEQLKEYAARLSSRHP